MVRFGILFSPPQKSCSQKKKKKRYYDNTSVFRPTLGLTGAVRVDLKPYTATAGCGGGGVRARELAERGGDVELKIQFPLLILLLKLIIYLRSTN